MPTFTRFLFVFLFCACFGHVFSQNLSIAYQNPSSLHVCGTDSLKVTLQNTSTAPLTGLLVTLTLPNGIEYLPGSASGASESDLSNLGAPKLATTDLNVGASLSFTVTIKASCSLIGAINSGGQFANTIAVTYAGGSQQLTTDFYAVETGLLFITSINPVSQSGQAGNVLTRTVSVRNTRQGAIRSLRFVDQHQGGMDITLAGIGGQNAPNLFQATVPGSYFTAFGDGDDLFEFNETITFTELITLKDCGVPEKISKSTITLDWGCDGTSCQADSTTAEVKFLPSNQNPLLLFVPNYGPPLSNCGDIFSVQEFLIINVGNAIAEDINLDINTMDSVRLGIVPGTFEWNDGGGWQPVAANNTVSTMLANCDIDTMQRYAAITLPSILPGDTLRVRFETAFCQYVCFTEIPGLQCAYSYKRVCPVGQLSTGSFGIFPDQEALNLESRIYFDIGVCLENDQAYEFDYWVKSKQLLNFTGFLRVQLALPWGLFWEPSCVPILDGQMPMAMTIDTFPNTLTTVNLTFQLPMSQDSVFGKICLRSFCLDPTAYESSLPSTPNSGSDFTIYPTKEGCLPCVQKVNAVTFLTTSPNANANCGISVCDEYPLILNCGCEDPRCVGGGMSENYFPTEFDSWRINKGLQDDNDDRKADNLNTANSPLIRLDRFLPGDTMRTVTRGVVVGASISAVSFRLFNEVWQSDFGLDGGDGFDILAAKNDMTSADALNYLNGSLVLKITSTGQQYTCPIGHANVISDRHYVKIAEPNIRPEQVYDELTSMFHEFVIDLPLLAATGCIPQNLLLHSGDSLILTNDFKVATNFTPPASNDPPLVNFRNTICGIRNLIAWKLDGCFPPLLRQYSGYIERFIAPIHKIEACGTSSELSPFRYSIRIARANLFPYEVRRLSSILDFQHSLPSSVSLLEARLNFFNMQEGISLFGNQSLPPSIANNILSLNFQPFFAEPVDEGFALESSLLFRQNCKFDSDLFALTRLTTRYFSNGFHWPDPFTGEIGNPFAYLSGQPKLNLTPAANIVTTPGDVLNLSLKLNNGSPNASHNTWLRFETSGDLTGLELVLLPQQQIIPSIGGVFQVGELLPFGELNFQLRGQLKICEPVIATIRYGWDCAPVTSPFAAPCGTAEKIVEIRPLFPELELVVLAQPTDVPMCAPSNIFEFEIYNANEGIAFGVLGSVKLPAGLSVVPNSSRLSYPAGSPFVNLDDPVALPGNVWQWTPDDASPNLAASGLQSIDDEPNNALRIRFRVQAECGFVANTRPIYGADGALSCGATSNLLRKPGAPIQLEGYGPSYDLTATLQYATVQDGTACGENSTLSATLVLDGKPNPGDSIYVVLPAGVSFLSGSYLPGQNAPAGPPQVVGNVLRLPFPANLPDNATVKFTFAIRYDDAAGCADQAVLLQARERISVFCPLINQNCAVYIATGESLLFLKAKNPDLLLQNIETTLNGNTFSFEANLLNEGGGAAFNPVVQLYLDQNGNGQIDSNEPLVATISPNASLAPGASMPIASSLNLPSSALCRLLAFIPAAANCACADKTIPLNAMPVVRSPVRFCEVVTAPIGVDSVSGNTYTWLTPSNISCSNCARTVFAPGPDVQPGEVVTLVLEEKTPNCTVEYRFELEFGGELNWDAPDQTICQGETVKLEPAPGGTYQWSGPGLSNPTAPVQIIQPNQSATYSVTITFNGGCTGSGQVNVTVFKKDSLDLGSLVTCLGSPVNVFGALTDQPGFYKQELKNTNGCDSVSYLRLVVYPNETFDNRLICKGDSVVVLDSLFTTSGQVCRSYTTSIGCDSTHCVAVEVLPEIELPTVQDSFVISAGEAVELQAPTGFVSYTWTPSAGLSCADCPAPLAKPDTSTIYLLTLADPNGCSVSVTYRVLFCDFEKLVIPTAFTPNGDGVNDVFRIVPMENLADVRTLTVYDRWGQKVWEGSGINAEWDGTINGKPAPSDVYAWLLTGGCDGESRQRKGDVGLLR